MFLLAFLAAINAAFDSGCARKAKAGNTVYVDCDIKTAQSATYDPDSRTCGRGTKTAYRTLKRAAERANAGQTVLIRAGTYNEQLRPKYSGTGNNYITFKNYPGEKPIITGPKLQPAIEISNREYIIVEGLEITNVRRWLYAIRSHHNIIRENHFSKAIDPGGSSKTGIFFQQAMFNTVVNNTIEDSTADNLTLIKSDRNRILGNVFRKAGHTLWTIKGGNFNVIRNNYFYNELQKIGEVYDCHNVGFNHEFYEYDCTKYNLIERNTFAYTPSSGNHSPYAGIQYAGQNGIIRNNLFYDTIGPGLDLTLYDAEATYNTGNRIYNNVFYGSKFAGISLSPSKVFSFGDNILKNNILAKSVFVANDTRWQWWTKELSGKPVQLLAGRLDSFLCQNNNFFDKGKNVPYLITLGSRSPLIRHQRPLGGLQYSYPELFRDNIELDPLFVDEETRDFHLKADSPMIDAGTFLTRALCDGSGVYLPVKDAGYFYDGYNIPGEAGDMIRLEGHECVARIVGIDYDRNILELSQSLVWREGQGVSLYYIGSRPDLGAFEFIPGGNHPPIAGFTAYPRADATLTVGLDGSASYDPDGNIAEYNWDLGDGTEIPNGEAELNHTYARPNTYTVTLRVTDDSKSQLTGIATLAVSVGQPFLDIQAEPLEFGPITRTKSIDLRNTGEGTLVYRISTSARWLSVDKSVGSCTTETRPIMVKVDRADLEVGQYTGAVIVDAGAAGVHHIEVSMKVPRLSEVKLIDVGDKWRYFKGTTAPPAKWNAVDFVDSNWLEGPSGIGYSNGDVDYPTFLNDMLGNYMTVYMRRLFEISDIDSVLSLKLGMCYDDGFVAYLNGREIARSRSMGPNSTPTRFDKGPILKYDEEDPEEIYHIEVKPGWLSVDKNILAVLLKALKSCMGVA